MAEDFVKRAFVDAKMASIDKETDLVIEKLEKQGEVAQLAAMTQVGLKRMDELCKVVILSGKAETLADYAQALLLVGFHIGYNAAKEEI